MNKLATPTSTPALRSDLAELAYAAGSVLMPYLVAALLLLAFA